MPGRGSLPTPTHHSLRTGFLLLAPGIKGKSVRLWHTAPGLTPALLAMGSEGRLTGKVAAALREPWLPPVPLPSQMRAALISAVWKNHVLSRAGYSGNPTLVTAE